MQLKDYGQKLGELEKLDIDQLDWNSQVKVDSEYARFFERDDMIPIKDKSFVKTLINVLNALVYVGIFVYFFGPKSLIAYLIALIPLSIIVMILTLTRYTIRKKPIN